MKAKEMIIFVGHDATRTGAPISLLGIVKWFATNSNHPCLVILNNDGPLVKDYVKYATLYIWNQRFNERQSLTGLLNSLLKRPKQTDQHLLEQHQASIISLLKRSKVGCIFNNTGVTGHILEALKPAIHAPIISRIPELEAYMRKNNKNGSVASIMALSDHFVAVSQAVKDNLVHRYAIPPEQVSVIYGACGMHRMGRGIAKLREKFGIPKEAFVVGGCGTMDWRKGVDLFIQVANRVVMQLGASDIYFCWIGGCVSHNTCIEYHYEVELLSLQEHLFFLDEVGETAPYLAELDLFLLTSREDPFPLVMLEAARQGVPIVCFERGGGATEFVDGVIGATVPMLDIAKMAHAVKELRKSPELRANLGRAAYDKSLAYTPEVMGNKIYDVLINVMQRKGAAKATQSEVE